MVNNLLHVSGELLDKRLFDLLLVRNEVKSMKDVRDGEKTQGWRYYIRSTVTKAAATSATVSY